MQIREIFPKQSGWGSSDDGLQNGARFNKKKGKKNFSASKCQREASLRTIDSPAPPTRLRGSCQLTRASALKTGVMGKRHSYQPRGGKWGACRQPIFSEEAGFHHTTSFPRVNKSRVWGWVGGYDIFFFFLQRTSSWYGTAKKKQVGEGCKTERWNGGEKTYQSNCSRWNSPFCIYDGAAKHMLVMRGAGMSTAGSMCLSSLLFWCFLTAAFCSSDGNSFGSLPLCPCSQCESPLKCHTNVRAWRNCSLKKRKSWWSVSVIPSALRNGLWSDREKKLPYRQTYEAAESLWRMTVESLLFARKHSFLSSLLTILFSFLMNIKCKVATTSMLLYISGRGVKSKAS